MECGYQLPDCHADDDSLRDGREAHGAPLSESARRSVGVKALLGFAAEIARLDHLSEQGRGPILRIVEVAVNHLHDTAIFSSNLLDPETH